MLLFDKLSNNDLVARCLNVYILNIYLQTMNLVVKRGSFWVMNLYRSQILTVYLHLCEHIMNFCYVDLCEHVKLPMK